MSPPPSPFAALLRRSKFASFDPFIGQVYTTHGGYAHRGNWGLKRPLPNRRRTGFITVRSVDSPEQQTEWSSAEASARWMKRWQEQGKSLKSLELGAWYFVAKKFTPPDSEFNGAGASTLEPSVEEGSVHDLPDAISMRERQFKKYLERVRALRPEFKKFLHQYALSAQEEPSHRTRPPKLPSERAGGRDTLKLTGSGAVDMYASAAIGNEVHARRFLTWMRARELYAPQSTALARQPHHFAGLEYTRISDLQAQYLHRPVRGRDVMQNHAAYDRGRDTLSPKVHYVAAGGVVGTMPLDAAGNLVPTDYGTQETPRRHREHGVGHFRMTRALLADPPTVVGRAPEGIAHTERAVKGAAQGTAKTHVKRIEFWPVTHENANRSNPYPLGSRAYIAKGSPSSQLLISGKMMALAEKALNSRASIRAATSGMQPPYSGDKILSALQAMIEKES
ncbi:mitochondrial ribosomal protein subunit-domain-containing protein [Hysterangium stoloniferum]|nr:mitochondrial ribosomal protein subunit-domain-containing protein [Hysterangium stoloniferum]